MQLCINMEPCFQVLNAVGHFPLTKQPRLETSVALLQEVDSSPLRCSLIATEQIQSFRESLTALLFGLSRDGFSGSLDGLGVAQEATRGGLERLVQLVVNGHASRDVELDDI